MQPDLAKARIVTYGFDKEGAVAYSFDRTPESGRPETTRHRRARLVRTAPHSTRTHFAAGTVYIVEFSAWATAATASAFGVCSSGEVTVHRTGPPLREYVVFDVAMLGSLMAAQPSQGEQQAVDSTILEMRPARRSLRDKAREEMSEFEREYPW